MRSALVSPLSYASVGDELPELAANCHCDATVSRMPSRAVRSQTCVSERWGRSRIPEGAPHPSYRRAVDWVEVRPALVSPVSYASVGSSMPYVIVMPPYALLGGAQSDVDHGWIERHARFPPSGPSFRYLRTMEDRALVCNRRNGRNGRRLQERVTKGAVL